MDVGGQHHFPAALPPPRQGALKANPFYRRLGGLQDQTEWDRVREQSVCIHETNILNLGQVRGYSEPFPDFPVRFQATALL